MSVVTDEGDATTEMASLLMMNDDDVVLRVLSDLFSDSHACETAATAEEALGRLGPGPTT